MKDGTVKVLAVATVLAFMCMAFACVDANNSNGNNVNKITPLGDCPTSGTDGGIDWNYDYDSCTLTISPSAHPDGGYEAGVMKDYSPRCAPWSPSKISYTNCELIVEDGVKNIGAYAFYINCLDHYEGNLSLPDTVTEIGSNAFDYSFDGTLTTSASKIDKYAFEGCSFHGDLDLSKTDYIGSYAFSGSDLDGKLITNATTIDEGAFKGCSIHGDLDLSKTDYIGKDAFAGCENLETVTVGASQIEVNAFACCGMKKVSFTNEHIEYIHDMAFGCFFLTDISFEAVEEIKNIGPCSFGLEMHFFDRDFSPITDFHDLRGRVFTGIAGTMWQCN